MTLSGPAQSLIAAETPRLLELWPRWCAQNSGSGNLPGLAAMADLVAEEMAALGPVECLDPASVEEIGPDGAARPRASGGLLRLEVNPDADRKVLLTGHLDTVFPPEHPFQTPQIEDGRLHGPGAADMKGGLLVLLLGLRAALAGPFGKALGAEVLLNSDEETGSLASAAHLRDAAERADLGLAFEPALNPEGTMAAARKGSGNFTVLAEGRAAHAGRNPEMGRNAVVALARVLVEVAALSGAREGLTATPAVVSGGTALNQVPDKALARINFRARLPGDAEWAEARLRAIAARIGTKTGVALAVHGGFHRPPKPRTPALEILMTALKECAGALGVPISWQDTGGVCDGNTLAATGLPVVDTLGVRGAHIHSAEEFAVLESLPERARLLALFLERVAAGAIPVPPREDRS